MAEKLVIYDSLYGNTAKIADAIGEGLGNAAVKQVDQVAKEDLEGLKILIVGSPTQAFRATPAIDNFLKDLDSDSLKGVKAAAFDTRITTLKFILNILGYADKKIEEELIKTGAEISLERTGFAVTGSEGPLADGELERAKDWAKGILG